MGVQVEGGGGGKSVDIDMNLVPFIDLMSCLVAFLLVTAVWTNVAQMKVTPKGVGRDAEQTLPTEPPVNISGLVSSDSVWVGLTTGDRRQIKNEGETYNFGALEEVLNEYKNNSGIFKDRRDIELAAEDGVKYQAVINAMDSAIAKGFPDIGFVDPNSLSVRFKQ